MMSSGKRNQTPGLKPSLEAPDLTLWVEQHRGRYTTPRPEMGEPNSHVDLAGPHLREGPGETEAAPFPSTFSGPVLKECMIMTEVSVRKSLIDNTVFS